MAKNKTMATRKLDKEEVGWEIVQDGEVTHYCRLVVGSRFNNGSMQTSKNGVQFRVVPARDNQEELEIGRYYLRRMTSRKSWRGSDFGETDSRPNYMYTARAIKSKSRLAQLEKIFNLCRANDDGAISRAEGRAVAVRRDPVEQFALVLLGGK